MKKRDTGLYLNSTNFQRLFLVSTMTAAKFLDDFYYSNKHWAQIGGITTQEINRLELEFLFRMGFSLHMQREEYDWYAEELLSRVDCTPAAPISDAQDSENRPVSKPPAAGPSSVNAPTNGSGAGKNPSAEDMDTFLSTHTTPKSSSSHMHDPVHGKQVPAHHMNMPVVPVGPTAPGSLAPVHPGEIHARVAYEAHIGAGAIVHPTVGSAMPMAVPVYHNGPTQPWGYGWNGYSDGGPRMS